MPGDRLIVVLDTCVLAPMPLCDALLRLAEEPAAYTPKWSADILRELHSTLQRMGYSEAQADRRLAAMQAAFEDALVEGYEHLASAMTNHPKDRHVLAAAVRCGAHAVVTLNVKDFRLEAVRPYGIEVLTPDDFLVQQHNLLGDAFRERIVAQARARGVTFAQLLSRIERTAPVLAQRLRLAAASSGSLE